MNNIEYRICYRIFSEEELKRMDRTVVPYIAIYELILDNLGNLIYISDEPTYPYGSDIEEFSERVQDYVSALQKPILNYNRLRGTADVNITYSMQNNRLRL